MHYYTFHPKDYMSKTNFLEPMEDLAYRRMLDYQYLNEAPLPADIDEIALLINMRTHSDSIATVLRYFFELTEDGYINDRAEKEIAKYQEKSEKARKSANARWKKKDSKASKDKESSDSNTNAMRTHTEGNANQEPLTSNQELETINQDESISIEIPFDTALTHLKKSGLLPIFGEINEDEVKIEIYKFHRHYIDKNIQQHINTKNLISWFHSIKDEEKKRFTSKPKNKPSKNAHVIDMSKRFAHLKDCKEA